MRYFITDLSLNDNILAEIEASIKEASWKISNFLSSNMDDVKIKLAIEKDFEDIKINKEALIIQAYYDDIKKALLEKLSMNTEKINSIHIGKFQPHSLIDYLMIEGTLNGTNNAIMSASGYTDMKEVTHNSIYGEMSLLTHNYFFQFIKEYLPNLEERFSWDCFDAINSFYNHITRLYLHKAIDKLYKEGLFNLHLKNRPFHIYYGEPNSYYYSVYFMKNNYEPI